MNPFRLPINVYLRYVAMFKLDASKALVRDGYHPNVILSKAEKSSRKGYTDYGTTPWYSWIESKGLERIEETGVR